MQVMTESQPNQETQDGMVRALLLAEMRSMKPPTIGQCRKAGEAYMKLAPRHQRDLAVLLQGIPYKDALARFWLLNRRSYP